MASELRVTTIANNAGTESVGSTYVINGSAKAWCTFQGTGTVSIKDSLNASSITDVNTGRYSVTSTNSLNNTDYNVQTSTHGTGSYSDWVRSHWYNNDHKSASSYRVEMVDEADTWYDTEEVSGLLHGDLA